MGNTSKRAGPTREDSSRSLTARLEVRLTYAQKALIERAAAYEGRIVRDFVVSALVPAAEVAVRDHDIIKLNAEQSRAFVEVLLNPPDPNDALRKAVRKHRRIVISR